MVGRSKKRKKNRQDRGGELVIDSSEEEGGGGYGGSGEEDSDEGGTDNDSKDEEDERESVGPSTWDWYDPSTIPKNGHVRRAGRLKKLELDSWRTAFQDHLNGQMDLSKTLLGLDDLRATTAEKERRVKLLRKDVSSGDEDEKTGETGEVGTKVQSSTSNHGDEEETTEREDRKELMVENADPGDDGAILVDREFRGTTGSPGSPGSCEESYPYPSSAYLDHITRWPTMPAGSTELQPLDDALDTLLLITAQRINPPRRQIRMKQRPPSAYDQGGPLYTETQQQNGPTGSPAPKSDDEELSPARSLSRSLSPAPSSSGSSSLFEDSDALDSSLDDPVFPPSINRRIISTLDQVLDRLSSVVDLQPLPPMSWEERRKRESVEAKKERKRKRPPRLSPAIGWETVVEAIKERPGISDAVLAALEERLNSYYGPPRPDALMLPAIPTEPSANDEGEDEPAQSLSPRPLDDMKGIADELGRVTRTQRSRTPSPHPKSDDSFDSDIEAHEKPKRRRVVARKGSKGIVKPSGRGRGRGRPRGRPRGRSDSPADASTRGRTTSPWSNSPLYSPPGTPTISQPTSPRPSFYPAFSSPLADAVDVPSQYQYLEAGPSGSQLQPPNPDGEPIARKDTNPQDPDTIMIDPSLL
ncbi:hypothetical protein T439DRAFT_384012 [Meredithblackwellia eburnea MCA 4105]